MNTSKKIKHYLFGPEISIFHEFHKPPYGGGNQFLMALDKDLSEQGYDIGRMQVGKNTKICMFNSFNFDFKNLEKVYKKYKPQMIHRLAGPIGIYRGTDIEIDKKTAEINNLYAQKTIFISHYSYNKYKELGLNFKNPSIILNACDPEIFNTDQRIGSPTTRKIKLIATAWSDNPKKGGAFLSWLDEKIDHTKFELTFVGRTKYSFRNSKIINAVPSKDLAKILKDNDIYIAPSEDDPCSNALIEALACGLPAVYKISGGRPEIVGQAGIGFNDKNDILEAVNEVSLNIEKYQKLIKIPSLKETAKKYIEVFNQNEFK